MCLPCAGELTDSCCIRCMIVLRVISGEMVSGWCASCCVTCCSRSPLDRRRTGTLGGHCSRPLDSSSPCSVSLWLGCAGTTEKPASADTAELLNPGGNRLGLLLERALPLLLVAAGGTGSSMGVSSEWTMGDAMGDSGEFIGSSCTTIGGLRMPAREEERERVMAERQTGGGARGC